MNWPSRSGIDPIELRIRNEPDKDPTTGLAVLVSRHIVEAWRSGCRAVRLERASVRTRRAARW